HHEKPDYTLLVVIIVLLIIGTVMVYSSSHIWAEYKYEDAFFFVKRQLLFSTVGIVSMVLIMSIPYALRSEEHTSELQSRFDLVCRLLLEKKKYKHEAKGADEIA